MAGQWNLRSNRIIDAKWIVGLHNFDSVLYSIHDLIVIIRSFVVYWEGLKKLVIFIIDIYVLWIFIELMNCSNLFFLLRSFRCDH